MANDSVGNCLDVLLVDLLRLEGGTPDLGVADGRLIVDGSTHVRGEVRASQRPLVLLGATRRLDGLTDLGDIDIVVGAGSRDGRAARQRRLVKRRSARTRRRRRCR